jgi:hypothetical protein
VRTPGTGATRWARAGLLALLTVLISVGGHALAGGTVTLSMPLLLGGAALGALCVAAADVRRSFAEIVAVVVLAQPVLHLLASMGGHGHAGPGAVVGVGPGMVLAHGVAAVAVSLLLADAERAFWTMAGLMRPLRMPDTPPACRRPLSGLAVVDCTPTPLHSVRLVTGRFGRAPPMVAAAL